MALWIKGYPGRGLSVRRIIHREPARLAAVAGAIAPDVPNCSAPCRGWSTGAPYGAAIPADRSRCPRQG